MSSRQKKEDNPKLVHPLPDKSKLPTILAEGLVKIRGMVILMKFLFEDDSRITTDAVYTVVAAAYRSVDGDYGAEQARQSGMLDNGLPFSLASVVGTGDLEQFQACNSDLARMTREEPVSNIESVR